MNILVRILVLGIAVAVSDLLLPGIAIDGFLTALIVGAVLILLNATLKPLLVILTLPVTLLSLGLFLLVINAFVIMVADNIVPGFYVSGFFSAILFSIVLSLVSSLLENISGT